MRYPWLHGWTSLRPEPAAPDYLASDLVRTRVTAAGGRGPRRSRRGLGDASAETRWLQEQAAGYGFPQAIVAHVALERDDIAEQLEAQAQSANVRGVRQMLDRDPGTQGSQETHLMTDPAWRRGLGLLADRGLVFDLQVLPSQLEVAARLADDFGDITFALNHGGYHVAGSPAWNHCGVRGSNVSAAVPTWS